MTRYNLTRRERMQRREAAIERRGTRSMRRQRELNAIWERFATVDVRAIQGDWLAVGDDLAKAMNVTTAAEGWEKRADGWRMRFDPRRWVERF